MTFQFLRELEFILTFKGKFCPESPGSPNNAQYQVRAPGDEQDYINQFMILYELLQIIFKFSQPFGTYIQFLTVMIIINGLIYYT